MILYEHKKGGTNCTMKKWKSILLAVLAVGSLASCGEGQKGTPISKKEAVAKISTVTDEMVKTNGFSIKNKASFEVVNSSTVNEVTTVENSTIFSTSSDTIVLLKDKALAGAQYLLDLNYEGKDSDGTTNTSIGLDFYIKGTDAYTHITMHQSIGSVDEENPEIIEEDQYAATTLFKLIESVNSIIESIGSEVIDEETAAMVEMFIENLPDPVIKSSKAVDTITWTITDKDVNNALTAILTSMMAPEIELPGDISIPEEVSIPDDFALPSDYMNEINDEIKAMVDEIDKFIDVKEFELSVSLKDNKYISKVNAKVDVQLNEPYVNDDGTVIETYSTNIKCNLNTEIKLLASDATIAYPEDIESWGDSAEEEEDDFK